MTEITKGFNSLTIDGDEVSMIRMWKEVPTMILKLNTTISPYSNNNNISSDYIYFNDELIVNWGDGTTNTYDASTNNSRVRLTHTYTEQGIYTITAIGDIIAFPKNAFLNNYQLIEVTLPNSLTDIGTKSFQNCINLEKVIIPNTITTISSNCFSGCTSLTNITLPESINTMGGYIFQNCTSLSSITFKSLTPPTIPTSRVFQNVPSCTIHVPCGTLNTYSSYFDSNRNRHPTTYTVVEDCH